MNDASATTKDAPVNNSARGAPVAGKIFRQPVPARLFAQAPINDLATTAKSAISIDDIAADLTGATHRFGPLTQAQENLIGALIVASRGLGAAISMLPTAPRVQEGYPDEIARDVVSILGTASSAVKAALTGDCPEGVVALLIDQSRGSIEDITARAQSRAEAQQCPSCDECGDGLMLPYTDKEIICDTCGVTRPRGRSYGGHGGLGGDRGFEGRR